MMPPREFIRSIRPFSFLSEPDLDRIVSGLDVALFEKGKVIHKKGQTSEYVYVIFSGLVGLFDEEAAVDYLSKGEIFGILSLYGNPLNSTARAIEDTVCYLLATSQFKPVFDADERFASFFTTFISRSFRSFKTITADRKISEEAALVLEVERIIYKKPVVCRDHQTVADAASEMDKHAISSIVVVNDTLNPIGILTHKDLKKVIVYGDKFDPIAKFMSSPVRTVTEKATIFDAFTTLVDAGIDHLVVTTAGKVSGVITRKDIQIHLEPSFSIVKLFRKVRRATSIDELKTVLDALRLSIAKMAMTGPNFFDLTRMLCTVHDAAVAKVIDIHMNGYSPDLFVWIQMGSSGRKEEIIATDQDNALICRNDIPAAWVADINQSLARIGFPKCPGNFMAVNDKWRHPLSVWIDYFRQWFTRPGPEHTRYLSVFLDMRPIYGNTALFDELLTAIGYLVTDEAVTHLALDAIEITPPLGIFGVLGLHQGVDLKTYGIYPIANGARALALDVGILQITNTRERLEALRENKTISSSMSHDLIESYGFLQDLRLRHHAQSVLNQTQPDNLIKGKELSKIDLSILKESLRIVTEFQEFLMKRYDIRRNILYSQL
jgi:CBS domain-containing protein